MIEIRRRGRPKGTGIDDRQRLSAIAEMMSCDPTLKATTAIKALGITDPSVIRRLRDKLNATHPVASHVAAPSSAAAYPSAY